MNLNNIINQLASTTSEELEQKSDRRNLLKGFGGKIAAAAVPFSVAMLQSNPAKAQSKETIIKVLNYLLKLEYISDKLYTEAAKVGGLIPGAFTSQFEKIATNTKQHIAILKETINAIGGTADVIDYDKIDLSGNRGAGGGPFTSSLGDVNDVLVLMAVLTDGGARIYKGQFVEVISDKDTLRIIANIHSVKARQAAFARYVRQYWTGVEHKPWVTGTNSETVNTSAQRAYAGEGKITQAGIDIAGINGFNINADQASQAFDEPLNQLDGENILNRFLDLK